MQLLVFAPRSLLLHVRHLMTSYTRTGFRGLLGNKGGVSVRFSLWGAEFAFVGCHLSPHLHNAEERITDFAAILYSQDFFVDGARGEGDNPPDTGPLSPTSSHQTRSLADHDYVFFCGDLNFRLDSLSRDEILTKIEAGDFASLLTHDQLLGALAQERIFGGFREMPITFAPTYKFDPGTDDYDTSAKLRKPAWCDRVLWKVKGEMMGCDDDAKVSVTKAAKDLEKSDDEPEKSSLGVSSNSRLVAESYESGPAYLISDHKPVCFTATVSVNPECATDGSTVRFLPISGWKSGQDSGCRFLIEGDVISDRWSWVGLYEPDFRCLADYITWNYATSATLSKDAVTDGKKTFSLSFHAKYVTGGGPRVLVFVSKNCVLGMSPTFVIE